MKQISIILVCCLYTFMGCVEKFDIEYEEYSDIVVIDAMVTDCDGIQTVYIRREKESLGYRYEPYYPPFEESSVHVEDDNGWSADFEDQDRGREFVLKGHKFEPGRTYTITVCVGNREFKATEKMVPLPDIEGLRFYAKGTKDGGIAYHPILYFKDNQPYVDNYYLFYKDIDRNSDACRYLSMQRLCDEGLRSDLDGIVSNWGLVPNGTWIPQIA